MGVENRLRYEFDLKKFLAVLNLLIERCGTMTKLKAAKLLYLVDRRHFNLHGRPILGDAYYRLDYGPIPSKALDLIDELIEAQGPKLAAWLKDEGRTLSKYFTVKSGKPHPSLSIKANPNLDVLSQSEKEALGWVTKNFGKKTAFQLVDITHQHATWKETSAVKEIDYRLFPKGDPEAVENIADVAAMEQEERAELLGAMSGGTASSVA